MKVAPKDPVRKTPPNAIRTHRFVHVGALLAIGVLAVGVRFLALARLGETGLLEQLTSDDLQYWNWAGELARTQDWVGSEPFFLGPLYPYFLAATQLANAAVRDAILFQCVLTSAVVLALAYTALRFSGARVALAMGALLATAPMLLLHDLSILAEALVFALSAAFAILPAHARLCQRPAALGALLGACVGLMALARPAYALLLVPALLVLRRSSTQRHWRGPVVAVVVACTLMLIPTMRHLALGLGPIGITYSAGYNFAIGNGPSATGYFVPYASDVDWQLPSSGRWEGGTAGDGRSALAQTLGRQPTPVESSRHFLSATLTWCLAHPGEWLSVVSRKLWWIVQGQELPQVSSMGVFEAVVGILAVPSPWFWGALLGLCGACVICRAKRPHAAYCAFLGWTIGVHLCVMLATFVIDRYKVHMIPAVLLLAAASVGKDGFRLASATRRAAATVYGAIVAWGAVTMPPILDANQLAFGALVSMGGAHMKQQQWHQAIASYERANERLRLVPMDLRATDAGRSAEASAHRDWSQALRRVEQVDSALARVRRAAELMPGSAELRSAEVALSALAGPKSDAVACMNRVPDDMREQVLQHLLHETRTMEGRGAMDEVTALMRVMADSWAQEAVIVVGLTRALIVQQEWDEAELQIERGRRKQLGSAICDAHRYVIEIGRGRADRAARWLARIPEEARADPRVEATLQLASWVEHNRRSEMKSLR